MKKREKILLVAMLKDVEGLHAAHDALKRYPRPAKEAIRWIRSERRKKLKDVIDWGFSFAEIGREIGISGSRVRDLYVQETRRRARK